jgi:glycolate oxidase FAD binding subunit
LIEQLSNSQMLSAQLGAIVGSEHVALANEKIAVAPADTAQAAAVLRFADENKLPVTPVGGGTKSGWGNRLDPKIVLHTHRMNALLEHTWQDMTCTVQAGCTWSSMQETLARHGQFVALDPLWPDRATVGGVMAANDSGTLRLKYGGLRDLIIGMTVVLADGTIARTGGKVVKNVAGYDLHKLMIGAFGTLGLATEITFRLHSLPIGSQSFTISSAEAGPLGGLMPQLIDSHLNAQSIQLRTEDDHFRLDIRLGALPEVLKGQSMLLLEMAKRAKLTAEEAPGDIWNRRDLLFADASGFTFKATMLPSDIARFTSIVRGFGGQAIVQATGIMTVFLPASREGEISELRREFTRSSGSLVVLQQPVNADVDLWGQPSSSFPLMQKIKQQFDPNRILNPGRFLGGI